MMDLYIHPSDFFLKKTSSKVDLLMSVSPNGISGCVNMMDTNFASLFRKLEI